MALRNANSDTANAAAASAAANTAATGPAFEAEEGDTTVIEGTTSTADTSATTTTATAEQATPQAAAPETPKVPAVVQRAVSNVVVGNPAVVKGLKDAIPLEALESMSFGVFPRITCDQSGGFVTNKNEAEHGKEIRIQVLSWNYLWMVTTGEKDNKEADKLIRNSHDGINLDNNEGSIADYIKQLKVDGYDKATTKKYIEIWAYLLWTKEKGEISAEDMQMVQISVSPKSVGQFERYQLETSLKRARGIQIDSDILHMTGSKAVNGSNTYGLMSFSVPKSQ